jgi:hypothetical protein
MIQYRQFSFANRFKDNQGTDTRRGVGLVLINIVGQCGPVLGTNIYPATDGPRYVKGMSVCAAFMFFNVIVAIVLRTLLSMENKKLDERQAKSTETNPDLDPSIAVENYGPNFRYVL